MLSDVLAAVRRKNPLVHCITNFVTVNDCANILLASGASPIMADTDAEMEEIVALADALVVNIGTISDHTLPAMFHAAAAAKRMGKPAILDPVGAGASRIRTETAEKLVATGAFSLVRGNISEIRAIAGAGFTSHGVDASENDSLNENNRNDVIAFSQEFSAKYNTAVAISGATDLIAFQNHNVLIRNGHPMMAKVTGSGCMLSALCGAFLAVEQNVLTAASAAICAMGVCGEIAHARLTADEGNATYRTKMIDAMFRLDGAALERMAKIETL